MQVDRTQNKSEFNSENPRIAEVAKKISSIYLGERLFVKFAKNRMKNLQLVRGRSGNFDLKILRDDHGIYYYARYIDTSSAITQEDKERISIRTKEIRVLAFNHPCVNPLLGWTVLDKKLHYVYCFQEKNLNVFLRDVEDIGDVIRFTIKLTHGFMFLESKGIKYACEEIIVEEDQPIFSFLVVDSSSAVNDSNGLIEISIESLIKLLDAIQSRTEFTILKKNLLKYEDILEFLEGRI